MGNNVKKSSVNARRIIRSILLLATLFCLSSLLFEKVSASVYSSRLLQPYATIAIPPIILSSGTAGTSTIYTNYTSAMVSVAAPVSGSTWGNWSSELLVNSGFEMGSLTGWAAMGPAAAYVSVFNATYGGDSYTQRSLKIGSYGVCTQDGPFNPGTNDSSGVWQNVSVIAYADTIDVGKAVINASAWLYPSEWAWDDVALIVRFYNVSGNFLSAWNTTGEQGSGTAYYPKAWMLGQGYTHFTQGQLKQFGCYNYPIPKGTRTVGIQLGMGEHKDANWCGGQVDEASIKIGSAYASYDYVLRVVNQITNAWNVRLQVFSSSNVNRLLNATIGFHDGTSSNQIIIKDGSITQPQGQWYNLPAASTIYVNISNLIANATGTSYVYVYLENMVPNTTTFLLYVITLGIT